MDRHGTRSKKRWWGVTDRKYDGLADTACQQFPCDNAAAVHCRTFKDGKQAKIALCWGCFDQALWNSNQIQGDIIVKEID